MGSQNRGTRLALAPTEAFSAQDGPSQAQLFLALSELGLCEEEIGHPRVCLECLRPWNKGASVVEKAQVLHEGAGCCGWADRTGHCLQEWPAQEGSQGCQQSTDAAG